MPFFDGQCFEDSPLSSAAWLNSVEEVARRNANGEFNRQPTPFPKRFPELRFENKTGEDTFCGMIVGIGAPSKDPNIREEDLDSAKRGLNSFCAEVYSEELHDCCFAVITDHVQNAEGCLAAGSNQGCHWIMVRINDLSHREVKPIDGETMFLDSVESGGCAKISHTLPGDWVAGQIYWAWVCFGANEKGCEIKPQCVSIVADILPGQTGMVLLENGGVKEAENISSGTARAGSRTMLHVTGDCQCKIEPNCCDESCERPSLFVCEPGSGMSEIPVGGSADLDYSACCDNCTLATFTVSLISSTYDPNTNTINHVGGFSMDCDGTVTSQPFDLTFDCSQDDCQTFSLSGGAVCPLDISIGNNDQCPCDSCDCDPNCAFLSGSFNAGNLGSPDWVVGPNGGAMFSPASNPDCQLEFLITGPSEICNGSQSTFTLSIINNGAETFQNNFDPFDATISFSASPGTYVSHSPIVPWITQAGSNLTINTHDGNIFGNPGATFSIPSGGSVSVDLTLDVDNNICPVIGAPVFISSVIPLTQWDNCPPVQLPGQVFDIQYECYDC